MDLKALLGLNSAPKILSTLYRSNEQFSYSSSVPHYPNPSLVSYVVAV